MNSEKFYISTPIYYVNDKPHIGHAYTTVLADVLARYNRSLGMPTFFMTGTDEHGQKVEKAAKAHDVTPQHHADETVVRFQELWKKLEITHDRFLRTTEANHKAVVQEVLQDLFERGEIYKASYTGFYCVACERFYTEKDLVDGNCPECKRAVSTLEESNYFFRMGKYREWLIDYIETHPGFIQPAFRANETLGFLRKGLDDLCISRPKSRLNWGIELPFDRDYVCYVWFDALLNYISGIGYRRDDAMFHRWWPATYHLIGKDILTTHTVYWPTMLKALDLPMPEAVFAHGWWLIGEEKMSKSSGNVVDPLAMAEKYGVDAFRYFLLAEMVMGQDASFSEDAFIRRYNSDLANDLGNLLSRVLKLTLRNGGVVPVPGAPGPEELALNDAVAHAVEAMEQAVPAMRLDQGIGAVLGAVRAGNRYLEQTAPWKLAKSGDTERLNTVLYTAAEALRRFAVLLAPLMPEKMEALAAALGASSRVRIADLHDDTNVLSGRCVTDLEGLFPRIQMEETTVAPAAPAIPAIPLVSIDAFRKTSLRVARVLTAEPIPGAKKLLKLSVQSGPDEVRGLVAGIAEHYAPEAIVGKNIVIVANLEPATIRGVESQGMLLAAKVGAQLKLLTVDGDIAPGAEIG